MGRAGWSRDAGDFCTGNALSRYWLSFSGQVSTKQLFSSISMITEREVVTSMPHALGAT